MGGTTVKNIFNFLKKAIFYLKIRFLEFLRKIDLLGKKCNFLAPVSKCPDIQMCPSQPGTQKNEAGIGTYIGLCLDPLSPSLYHFSFHFLVIALCYLLIQTNGSWNGVLGYIENGTVDTACLFYQRTGLRAKHFSFTYPIINVSLGNLKQSLGQLKLFSN